MNHVVMFSSGVGSWATAKRVAEQHGTDGLTLLFADVLGEDEDNYRFLHEAAENVGGELVVVTEGRTIWQVYEDEHMLGNSRVAPCSKLLKQVPCRRWLAEHHPDPSTVTLYVGIDWTEEHRLPAIRAGWAPYMVEAPLCDPPWVDKAAALDQLRAEGIKPPRLYEFGFQHANCGGFCCRMGHAQAAHLLRVFPDRYSYHEEREEAFRQRFGWDVAFMRDRRGGTTTPLTLRSFRERIEAQGSLFDPLDWDACGCFFEGDAA